MRSLLRRVYRTFVPVPIPPCDLPTIAVLTHVLQPKSNAIDVGCNQGSILREIVRLAPSGKHMAFEPIPRVHRLLSRAFPSVDCRRIALSDAAGTTHFSHYTRMDGFSGMMYRRIGDNEGPVEQIEVQMATLDSIVSPDESIALIKIDVEGAELRVLRGAQRILREQKPVVVFECGKGGLDLYGHAPDQLFDLLRGCGLGIAALNAWSPSAATMSREQFVDAFWKMAEFMFVASPSRV
ncbi:MAG: FkbM family methyltransferase [Anaerolineae bacterium]|nr:FkbM family methyltransferase [Phycisphaerae bacterium]